jgi:lipid-binding SYLF domain-containing protein
MPATRRFNEHHKINCTPVPNFFKLDVIPGVLCKNDIAPTNKTFRSMSRLVFLSIFLGSIVGNTAIAQSKVGGWDPDKPDKKEKEEMAYAEAVAEIKEQDPDIQRFFDSAYAYAVFPSVGKGAFIVGGAHGKGRVYRQGEILGTTELTQATVGLQMGGQSYREFIFFKDEDAFLNFAKGDLKFSGQASAVAVKDGASANVAYNDGVAVFTLVKGGLMYEASIGGQSFTYASLK